MASADLDLCYMTATEAISKFKAKELSPVELMGAVIARCEEVRATARHGSRQRLMLYQRNEVMRVGRLLTPHG